MFQSKYQFYIDAWRTSSVKVTKSWSRDDKDKMFIDMYGRVFRYTKSSRTACPAWLLTLASTRR